MKVLLNAKQIDSTLNKLTNRIVADIPEGVEIAVIGIRSRGEIVAQRLAGRLSKKIGGEIPCGPAQYPRMDQFCNAYRQFGL